MPKRIPSVKIICWALAALIISILFVVRLIFSLGNDQSLFIDIYSYENSAMEILNHGYSTMSAYHPPAYPTFIALCYAIFGQSKIVVYVIQAILASLSLILVFRVAEKLVHPLAGLFSVMACALYIPLTLYSGIFLSETLFLFLLLFGVYTFICFIKKQTYGMMALSAFAFGLSTLTRSINQLFILLIPCFLFFLIFILRRGRRKWTREERYERSLKGMPIKKALISCAVFIGVFISTLTPWTIRNAVLFKDFIPVDTLGGLNLLVGNNEYSRGLYITFSDEQFLDMIKRYTGREQPLKIKYPNGLVNLNDKALKEAGINYILSHPKHFIKLTIERARLFLTDDFRDLDWVLQTSLKKNTFIRGERFIPLIEKSDRIFFICSLLGLPFLLANRRTRWLFLIILYYWGSTSCFYVTARYRMPIMPFMAISAGMLVYGLIILLKKTLKW